MLSDTTVHKCATVVKKTLLSVGALMEFANVYLGFLVPRVKRVAKSGRMVRGVGTSASVTGTTLWCAIRQVARALANMDTRWGWILFIF